MIRSVIPLLSTAILFCSGAGSPASPGDPDPAFSSDGIGLYPTALGYAVAAAEQADGATLVAGSDGVNVYVIRVLANGGMDPAFGTSGRALISLGFITECAGLIALPDGKFLFAGSAINNNRRNFQVLRLLANGSPDPSFGTDGKTITIFDPDYSALPVAMVRQPDGRILLAGQTSTRASLSEPLLSQIALAGYLPDGAPDPSFGTGGKQLTPAGPGTTSYAVTGMVLQPDGRFIVAGNSTTAGRVSPALYRFLHTGVLDTGFGAAGRISFNDALICDAIALRPDGRILLGCSENSVSSAGVIRLHPDGALDESMAGGGFRRLESSDGQIQCGGLVVTPHGKILLAATLTLGQSESPLLLRMNSDGGFDTSFAGTGAVYPLDNSGRFGSINTLTLLRDGKIFVAGRTGATAGGATHYYAARFEGDGIYVSPLAAWRQTHFGTTENSGPAADTADPDGDGVSNLLEYAFQQIPTSATSRTIPVFVRSSGNFTITFPHPDPAGSKLLTFGVEATVDPSARQWIHLKDVDPGTGFLYGLNMTGNPRAFFRLRVAAGSGP